MKVRKNKFGKWETNCKGTDEGGNVFWYNLPVQFNRCCMPDDDDLEMNINPTNWWHSAFWSKKENRPMVKFVINAYEPMGAEHGNPSDYGSGKITDEDVRMFGEEPITINDEPITDADLPFYGG